MTSDELKLAAEYNRGWQDGKHAKSADEWWLANAREDVVRKLREVKLDGGSHANLSAICKCIFPADWWTKGACVALREELIGLLGGNDTPSGPLPTFDMLDNERHKAARRLEESKPLLGMTKTEILGDLGKAVTNLPNFDPTDIDHLHMMWSDLIYLLGGDNGTCPNDDGTCPNGVPNASITAELRGHIDEWCKAWQRQASSEDGIDPATLYGIADRIDAQFARICEQQESVLQATIGQMCEECDRLQAAIDLKDRALDAALAKTKDFIEPPKDRDGRTWRIGDLILYDGKSVTVDEFVLREDGWTLESDFYSFSFDPNCCIHYTEHIAESIVRDLTLGKISESEAVKRIEELRNE